MSKPELIARQSAHPRGLLGHIVARVMAFDTASVNRRVLEILRPEPGERILELGCGHGRALRRVAKRIEQSGCKVILPEHQTRAEEIEKVILNKYDYAKHAEGEWKNDVECLESPTNHLSFPWQKGFLSVDATFVKTHQVFQLPANISSLG